MSTATTDAIQIAFHSLHSSGAVQQRLSGINATRHADNGSGEQWEFTLPVLRGHTITPKVGDKIIPTSVDDRRPRTITDVKPNGPTWLCTCPTPPAVA